MARWADDYIESLAEEVWQCEVEGIEPPEELKEEAKSYGIIEEEEEDYYYK